MQRYSEYKDSGVKWLGEIPSHWEVKRLASFFTERRVKVSDKEYEPISVTKQGVFPQLDNVAKTNDGDNRKLVKEGDFVINSRSDRKGSSGVADRDGSVSLINIVLKPRKTILAKYSNYLLKSYKFIEEYYKNGRGIVADLWTTRFDEMKMIKLAIPTLEEQEAIATYLDEATSKIDAAIAQQQRMIELLNERKQIIINNAVTKGLDPNVKMKDSGVEWIGETPEHWEVRRFKTIAKVKSNLVHPKDYLHYPQISPDCIEKGSGILLDYCTVQDSGIISDNHLFYKGQIVYSKIRPTLNKVIIAPFNGLCSADMYPIETTIEGVFLQYIMLSVFFSGQVQIVVNERVKMPKINKEELGNILIVLPPNEEQRKIAEHLTYRVEQIHKSIQHYRNLISFLQERRQIIINDTVTGKMKVI